MTETLGDILGSEVFIQLLAAVIAAIWIAAKSTKAYEWAKAKKFDTLLEAVEVSVDEVYKEYVKSMKTNGEWDESKKSVALDAARQRAIDYAKSEGIDALKLVTTRYLDVLIEDVIRERKKVAATPSS